MSEGPRRWAALLWFAVIIAAGIANSSWATRHDSYTIDEPWHIVAGVSYYREGSLRLNPEHPPLVKLWIAPWVESGWFRFPSPGRLFDKLQEREYADKVMFSYNDADRVQHSARRGMYWFHGLLFLIFGALLSIEAGVPAASLALLFLLFDPTVAAHLPVVMTDLPLAILGGISLVLVARLARTWAWPSALLLGLFLGLTLASKHSALILLSVLPLLALAASVFSRVDSRGERRRRVLMAVAAGLLPVVVLWATYGFRYWERTPGEDWFNRPLKDKIDDVRSPWWKSGLRIASNVRVVPRAYLWGLADVVRAGIDGRMDSALVFGKIYVGRAPLHYMPSAIATKLTPAGLALSVLALYAVGLAWRRRRWFSAESIAWIAGTWMLLVLIRSGTVYGGVRHALFLWMMIAVAAAAASSLLWRGCNSSIRAGLCVLWVAYLASAARIERPWSYHNQLAGGTESAHLSIGNEGLDLGHRSREIAEYYHRELKPRGTKPLILYFISKEEWDYRRVERIKFKETTSHTFRGVVIAGPAELSPGPEDRFAPLRGMTPKHRIGTVQVFEGTVALPRVRAYFLFYEAVEKLAGAKPELEAALAQLVEAAALGPDLTPIQIELGNTWLRKGGKQKALAAYRAAREGRGVDEKLRSALEAHMASVEAAGDPAKLSTFRNPAFE
jgi:hypothetical protein